MTTTNISIISPSPWLLGLDLYFNPNNLPRFLLDVFVKQIKFQNKEEFNKKLDEFIKEYKKNHLSFIPHHHILECEKLDDTSNSNLELQYKYPFLTLFKSNNDSWTNKATNIRKEHAIARLKNSLLAGVGLALLLLIPFMMNLITLSSIVLAPFAFGAFTHLKELYLHGALLKYNFGYDSSLKAIDNKDRFAFENGESATSCLEYFSSFFSPTNYFNPIAFAGGMKKQMDFPTKTIYLNSEKEIDFEKFDARIIPNRYWLHSYPMQTSIEVPTLYEREIVDNLRRAKGVSIN